MKAIGYARTASKEHAMRSIEKQKEQIAEYCNKKGYDLLCFIADIGIKADIERLLKSGANAVVVTSPDRLTRSKIDYMAIKWTLENKGMKLEAVSEPPKSPVEKMVKNIMDMIDVIANERIEQELPRLDEILHVYDVARALLEQRATIEDLREAVKGVDSAGDSERLAEWQGEDPANLWDGFLGDQSPAEFMEFAEGMTPEEAVEDFLDHGIGGGDPQFEPLTEEEKEVLRKKLVAHIKEEKYYDS